MQTTFDMSVIKDKDLYLFKKVVSYLEDLGIELEVEKSIKRDILKKKVCKKP